MGMILKIQGFNVRVKTMTQRHKRDYGDNRGLYIPKTRSIALDHNEPPMEQADTLIHEIVHAIWDARGMGVRCTEESVANQLGTALAEAIRDNPLFLPTLQNAVHFGQPIVTKE